MVQVIPQQNRSAGTYESPDVQVPNRLNQHSITLTLTMSNADANDSRITLPMLVEGTMDPSGATGWYLLVSQTWQCGPNPKTGGQQVLPWMSLASTTPLPERVRAKLTTNRTFSWGVDVSVAAE